MAHETSHDHKHDHGSSHGTDHKSDHGHGDHGHAAVPESGPPVSSAKFATWMFLASEVMFFTGLIGAYIVLKITRPEAFELEARHLNKWLAFANTLVLICSSFTMVMALVGVQERNVAKFRLHLALTAVLGTAFLGVKVVEYQSKFNSFEYVPHMHDGKPVELPVVGEYYDRTSKIGAEIKVLGNDRFVINVAKPKPAEDGKPALVGGLRGKGWDPKANPPTILDAKAADKRIAVDNKGWSGDAGNGTLTLTEETDDGPKTYTLKLVQNGIWPWTNVFFAAYFTMTGLHALHMLGGIIPFAVILLRSFMGIQPREQTIELFGLYWHFVDVVWIFLFPLLYLMP